MIEVDETNELSQVSCCGRLWELADNFNLGVYWANTLTAHMMPQDVDPKKAFGGIN